VRGTTKQGKLLWKDHKLARPPDQNKNIKPLPLVSQLHLPLLKSPHQQDEQKTPHPGSAQSTAEISAQGYSKVPVHFAPKQNILVKDYNAK